MPAIFAWVLVIPGFVFIAADMAADWTPGGLALLGVVFLVVGAYMLGVFTSEFWFADDATADECAEIDRELDAEAEIRRAHEQAAAKSGAWR